jgi:hypothetical protein
MGDAAIVAIDRMVCRPAPLLLLPDTETPQFMMGGAINLVCIERHLQRSAEVSNRSIALALLRVDETATVVELGFGWSCDYGRIKIGNSAIVLPLHSISLAAADVGVDIVGLEAKGCSEICDRQIVLTARSEELAAGNKSLCIVWVLADGPSVVGQDAFGLSAGKVRHGLVVIRDDPVGRNKLLTKRQKGGSAVEVDLSLGGIASNRLVKRRKCALDFGCKP